MRTDVIARLDDMLGPRWAERRTLWNPDELLAARRTLGLSRADAAVVIGCSERAVETWEWGQATPHRRFREAIETFIEQAEQVTA